MKKDNKEPGVMEDHGETNLGSSSNNIKRKRKPDKLRPFKCSKPQCTTTFSSQFAMEAHVRFVHDGIKGCEHCPKAFRTLPQLHVHVRLVHSRERKFECKVCSRSFCAKNNLKRHMITHLTNRERRWKCEVCSKTFMEEIHLLQHLRSHTGEKPYSCEVCGKGFSYPVFLKMHAVVHIGKRPTYSCSICSKTFGSTSGLREHNKVHTGERRLHHGCNLCDKRFRTKDHLERHMSCHTGERPYRCSICSKSFPIRDSLRNQVNFVHLATKKAECVFCLKMFQQSAHLFQHLWVHTKEAPYFCKMYPAEFKCRSNHARHIITQHSVPKRNLRCQICSKECVSASALALHKRCHRWRSSSSDNHYCSSSELEELVELGSQKNAAAEPIPHYSCIICFKEFSRFGHMCNTSALQRWNAQCRISNY